VPDHTRGPWEVVPSGPQFDDDLFVRQVPGPRGYGNLICRVLHSRSDARAAADARLIAAAPELLSACEAVLDFWGSHEAWGDFASLTSAAGAFAPVADKAREAVEKARGEEP
jgi:hypothetical protein